ncbi:MAG: Mfa1 fimbrilin C-terminal domain-containing protein [Muribaculaceae bacterium]|nr:Mfa1 fimbrilin C-terminal domain-containing protein [Muribaculaceae bacterium]
MNIKATMKQSIRISLVSGVVFAMASCTADRIDNPGTPGSPGSPGSGESEPAAFMGFRLEDASIKSRSTHHEYDDDYERFEWFNKGTKDERAIIENPESNRVLFFNSDYSYYGAGKLQKPEDVVVADNVYVAQKPQTDSMYEYPAYALIVLNADPERLDALDLELTAAGSDAVKRALSYLNEVDTDDPESLAMYDGHFTMSSVVYRDEESPKLVSLAELNPLGTVFYETIEEAVLPENLTLFYVERLLAKFTLIVKDGNQHFNTDKAIVVPGEGIIKVRQTYAPTDNEAKDVKSQWRVNLVNWGVNALEKNTYLFKVLSDIQGVFPFETQENFYIGWNSPKLKRSFWAIDENYASGIYPQQYRQALDVEGVFAATENNIYSPDYNEEDGPDRVDYTLLYKPYNAYTQRNDNKYSLENTFDASIISPDELASQPWLRCGTHILLTAQFIIDEVDKGIDLTRVDENGFIPGVSDKYFSNGLYWSETALKQQALATLATNIYFNKKGSEVANVLEGGFVDFINGDGKTLDDTAPIAIDNGTPEGIVLKHEDLEKNAETYFEFAPAFIKGGDGWVSLKLKDGYKLMARYVDKNTGEVTLGEISQAQLVSYIYRFTNLAKHFNEGRMYYAIAVRHNLESQNFESSAVSKVSTGDYGVARNTWYRMTINSILKPGTPVDDPNQPIIPNPEPDDKSLGVEVEIIPWETVKIDVGQLH